MKEENFAVFSKNDQKKFMGEKKRIFTCRGQRTLELEKQSQVKSSQVELSRVKPLVSEIKKSALQELFTS
jgi:hypothetical protein